MVDAKILVEKLISYAQEFLSLNDLDVVYTRNMLLKQFNLSNPTNEAVCVQEVKDFTVPDVLIEEIKEYTLESGISSNEIDADLFANYVFGLLTPRPSEVNKTFTMLKENFGAETACNYLYDLSQKNYYIRKTDIEKNVKWEANKLKIPLEITINLSKPEKNNKDIAKLLTQKQDVKYPNCMLCIDNEGYYGHATQPARSNLRTISIDLGGENWYMQYSPYLYYDEHCIVFNKTHTPMAINAKTIEKLFDFIELFPHYFIGSNSDLPIVGGSILNHEHYQGGRHEMPLHKCKALKTYESESYQGVSIQVVDFYNSVIRIAGYNRNAVEELAGDIIEKWKGYSDETVNIIASDEEGRHNTVTPIARFLNDNRYCVELILRNNKTSEEHPDGIFHAHKEYHNIKSEGIGLIEAMGLYILPARLNRQLNYIAQILCGQVKYNKDEIAKKDHDLYIHRNMIETLKNKHKNLKDFKKATVIITEYVNETCASILRNTAVFKDDKQGVIAFNKFLNYCNLTLSK
ncbi:MAG: UDP-glucose--hexose-1-phosphate uridylyltransferase [Clostridia bacterium]|nr:UDP-glucose--hexose-1-phosphate uridylyltransferase [Clostridia bacterium]